MGRRMERKAERGLEGMRLGICGGWNGWGAWDGGDSCQMHGARDQTKEDGADGGTEGNMNEKVLWRLLLLVLVLLLLLLLLLMLSTNDASIMHVV